MINPDLLRFFQVHLDLHSYTAVYDFEVPYNIFIILLF